MRRLRVGVLAALVAAGSLAAAAQSPSAILLVLLHGDQAIAFVESGSGTVLGRMPTDKEASSIAVSDDGRLAFTAYAPSSIAVIDVAQRKEIRRVDVGPESRPADPFFFRGKLYFKANGYKAVGRLDPATGKVDWFVGHGQNSVSRTAISSDGDRIYLTHRDTNRVTAIDGVSAGPPKWTVTTIPVSGSAEGIDISPDGREAWVALRFGAGVSIIDTATKKVTEIGVRFQNPNDQAGASQATRVAFTPDGKRVLILSRPTQEIVALDAASRKEIKRIPVHGDNMLITPDGSRLYVTVEHPPDGMNSHVAVIDLQALTITSRIETGGGPTYMAWAGR